MIYIEKMRLMKKGMYKQDQNYINKQKKKQMRKLNDVMI